MNQFIQPITMSSLFRSETMSYVRVLMSEEASIETLTAVGKFGSMQIIDLSMRSNQFYHQSNSQSINQQHSAINERRQRLKKRAVSCLAYEKRLQSLKDIFVQFDVELPDLIDIDDELINRSINEPSSIDSLDEAEKFLDPLESAVSSDILFKRHQTAAMNEMRERMQVIESIFLPMKDGNETTSIRQRLFIH